MSGSEPQRIAMSLTYARLVSVIISLIAVAIMSCAWAVAIVIEHSINAELTPPTGTISKAIDRAVLDHSNAAQIEMMKAAQENEKRLLRMEWMIERVFTQTTDLPLPNPVGEQ